MTGVNIIHTRQVPSIPRKAIRTAILKAIEIETDRPLVLQIPHTPVIRTFLLARTGQNPITDPVKAKKEVPASRQVIHTGIIPLLTVTHMAVIGTANPIMLTVMRVLLGLNIPVLLEKCIITIAKQRSPSGRNPKSGLSEKEERKRERNGKKEMWLELKMDVMAEIQLSIESYWLPPNQANIYLLRIFAVIITVQLRREILMNQGTPPLITEKTRTDSLKMIEGIRWSRHVQCTLQLFLLLFIGLPLLPQMLEEKQLFHLLEACKMFLLQQRHLHAPTCMGTTPRTLPLRM